MSTAVVSEPSGFALPQSQLNVIKWNIYFGFAVLAVGVIMGLGQALNYARVNVDQYYPVVKSYYQGTDDSWGVQRAGAHDRVRQRLHRADYRARARAQAQQCAPACGVLDAFHRLAAGGVCDVRRQGLGPLHLLPAAGSPLDVLPRPRAGGDQHLDNLGGPAGGAARMAQGSSGRASAAARLHVDRNLRDVGYRIGRPRHRGRGVPAAMVAGIASGRRSDAQSHAVLVHGASDRVLLAAADLRFMVRTDSETGRRRAVQRHR